MGATVSAEGPGAVTRPPSARNVVADSATKRAPFLRHRVVVWAAAIVLAPLAASGHSVLADQLIAASMAVVLVTVAATDLERRVIPNRVVLPALAIVLVARLATSPSPRWVLAALGAGLLFLLPTLINSSAMGMGDVKLAAFLGAGLGTAVIGALLVASLGTLPFVTVRLFRDGLAARKSTLPFGPFLAFGGLVILIVPRLFGVAGG